MPSPSLDSLIDRVDDSNRKIGSVRRRDVFRERAGFRTVHVFVVNSAGQLLLQRIGPSNARSASRWGSSVAGYLNRGESYRHAAARRMREEIGVTTPLRQFGTFRFDDDGATKFVTLFEASSATATIKDPDAIEALEYWDVTTIEEEMDANPDAFTDTFRQLFVAWRRTDIARHSA